MQELLTPATEAPNLSPAKCAALLKRLGACQESRDWAKGQDYATAWTTCSNPDWLLWLLEQAGNISPRTNELLVCRFAREVVHLNPDPRVLACIETREAWARGEATDAARDAAGDAAGDAARAAAGDAAGDAARAAAGDAAWAAAWAAAGDAARAAAGDAAWAAARDAAGDAAWAAAWAAARAKQCNIIREMLPRPTLS